MTDPPDDYPLIASPTPENTHHARLGKFGFVGLSRESGPPEALGLEMVFVINDEGETCGIVLPLHTLEELTATIMMVRGIHTLCEAWVPAVTNPTPEEIAKFIDRAQSGVEMVHRIAQMVLDGNTDGLIGFINQP